MEKIEYDKKTCSKCGLSLSIKDFYPKKSICKTCLIEYVTQRRRGIKITWSNRNKKKTLKYKCAECSCLGIQRGHTERYSWHRCAKKKDLVKNIDNACRKFKPTTDIINVAYNYEIYSPK
jgi:hypothetical protein